MTDFLKAWTASSKIARRSAFVYIIRASFDMSSVVYVGQTFGTTGALGRLAEHLGRGPRGTFHRRVCDLYNFDEVFLTNVDIWSWKLPSKPVFEGKARDYREAVEHLVQIGVIKYIKDRGLQACVVSRTRGNPCIKIQCVKREAERVVRNLASSEVISATREAGL